MKYHCQNHFMIRVPSLPIEVFNKIDAADHFSYDSFLGNEKLKNFMEESTLVASRDLYAILRTPPNDSGKKLRNLNNSILKYIIRASTRPTPYGLYAGVGLGEFSTDTNIVIKENDYFKDVKADSQWIACLIHKIEMEPKILQRLNVKFNPICYELRERIYNPYFTNHGEVGLQDKEKIRESDIRSTGLTHIIAEYANKFVPYIKLKQYIESVYKEVPEQKVIDVLADLIENEYLLTNLRLPAFCPDSIEYVIQNLRNIPSAQLYVGKLKDIQTQLKYYRKANNGADYLQKIYNNMSDICKTKNYCVINKALGFESKFINNALKDKLEYFVETLGKISVLESHLKTFKEAFSNEFGYGIEVALLDVINPDGFNGLSYIDEFLNDNSKRENDIKEIIDDKILMCLINNESEVKLKREDFSEFTIQEDEKKLAVSLDINFYLSIKKTEGKDPYLLTVAPNGGATRAGGMFQRFADAFEFEDLRKYNSIYLKEKIVTQDDYILVEVREAPSMGRHTNIINCYKNLDYFLPIGCDGMDLQGEISLQDLFIGLSEMGSLYIYSDKHKKKCKIVTNNMLNTKLNGGILRLLKYVSDDYESQIIARIFNLTKNRMIFTPRILLDDVVISPKRWNLKFNNKDLIDAFCFKEKIIHLIQELKIDDYILVYESDNRLLLNISKAWAIDMLFTIAKQQKGLTLSEIPSGIFEDLIVKDENGYNYFAEYTFSFIKEKNKSKSNEIIENPIKILQKENRELLPGEDGWLYIKLYGAINRQNKILTEELSLLLDSINIKFFFYIRYNDPKPHLRLRFKFNQIEDMAAQIIIIMNWIDKIKKQGYIETASFDTYKRENNRYGGERLIKEVENIFYFDSIFTISLLKKFDLEENDLMNIYMVGILTIIKALSNNNIEIFNYLNKKGEEKGYIEFFHKSNKQFTNITRSILNEDWESIDSKFLSIRDTLSSRKQQLYKFKKMIDREELSNNKKSIVLSIVHMFCNRVTGDKDLEYKFCMILRHSLKSIIMQKKHDKGNT